MKKKILIVFLIIIVLGFGYYLFKPNYICWPYCPRMTDEDREEIKESALNVATRDWKVYVNTEFGFQFEYPEDFYITNEGDWNAETPEELVHYIDVSKYEIAPPREYPGIRIIIRDSEDKPENTSDIVYFSNGGKLYTINNGIDKKIFNKFLATFEFSQARI